MSIINENTEKVIYDKYYKKDLQYIKPKYREKALREMEDARKEFIKVMKDPKWTTPLTEEEKLYLLSKL